jgi:hypothetical protein
MYHTSTHTLRAGLLERMPVMSTKASSTVEGSIVQNGEPAAPSAVPAPQLSLQVSLVTVQLSYMCIQWYMERLTTFTRKVRIFQKFFP